MRARHALIVIVLGIFFPLSGYASLPPTSAPDSESKADSGDQLASANTIKNSEGDKVTDTKPQTKADELAKYALEQADKKRSSNDMKGDGNLSCVSMVTSLLSEKEIPTILTHDTIEFADFMRSNPNWDTAFAVDKNMSQEQQAQALTDAIRSAPPGAVLITERSPLKEEKGIGSWGHVGIIEQFNDGTTRIYSNGKLASGGYGLSNNYSPEEWVNTMSNRRILNRTSIFVPKTSSQPRIITTSI